MDVFSKHYTKAPGFDTERRANAAVEVKKGKEESDKVIMGLKPPILDTSKVQGTAAFSQSTWFFGYAKDLKWVGFPPNASGQLRLQHTGQLTVIAIELSALLDNVPDDCKKDIESVRGFVKGLAEEAVQQLRDQNVKMYVMTCGSGDAFFVPQGFLAVEYCSSDTPALGIRKNFFTSGLAVASFEAAASLFELSRRPTANKMKELATLAGSP